jgi:pimeloyl-ACP methyl ester carboxylesterase
VATFMLVHDAWHGAWCWRELAILLRLGGHEVVTPTLTGLGERGHLLHLLGVRLGLDIHVQDAANVLEFQDLREVILVGHGYAGMVIAGASDLTGDRLARVVYLDAFVPEDGQAMFDVLSSQRRERYEQQARELGDGWLIPPLPVEALGLTDAAQARRVAAKLTAQPLRTFEDSLRLANQAALARTYIRCTAGVLVPSFERSAVRAKEEGWGYRELDTGHDAMLTQPRELAAVLGGLAAGR